MADFPAHLFRMDGDPTAIRSSARAWTSFGDAATDASRDITSLDTGEFIGPEGDQFREGLNEDLPPHLRVTGEAYRKVGDALSTFTGTLSSLQDEMRPLAQRAPGLWEAVRDAQQRVSTATEDDAAHARDLANRPPDQASQPDNYNSDTGAASSALSGAQRAWQECVDAANTLRSRMTDAVNTCADAIDDAKGMRFKENPKGLGALVAGVKDFIKDNVEGLQFLSGALKAISMVAGVLSFIPVLTPIMLPIALGTAAAALVIDVSIYAATGQGSLTQIIVDGALLALPGVGRLAKPLVSRLAGAAKPLAASALNLGSRAATGLRNGITNARQSAVQLVKRVTRGDPIDIATGEMVLPQTDVELAGALPLVLTRTYVSSYRTGWWFGPTWASTVDQRLEVDDEGVCYASDDGMLLLYPTPDEGASVLPQEGPRRPLTRDSDGGYTITDPEQGHTLHFAPTGHSILPLTTITDRNGQRINFDHDTFGVLTAIRHSGGYHIDVESTDGLITSLRLRDGAKARHVLVRYEYDHDRQLTEVINSSGVPLRFDYDTAGRIIAWHDRNGTSYRYTYDENGRCVQTTGTDGFLDYTYDYDRDDLVTTATNSLGQSTTYHLNDALQVERETDSLGNTTVSEWDQYDRLLARTDPLGRTTRYTYDESGNLRTITRPDGSQSTAEYNHQRQPITITDYNGATWRRDYDERGNLTAVTDPLGATTSYTHDPQGDLTSVTDALGHAHRVETNPAGLPTTVTDPVGATTTYAYDAAGRTTTIIDPIGGTTRLTWTPEGKLASRTRPDGATERWSYDGEGNVVEYTDPVGQVTRTQYTHFDLPAARTEPDGSRLEFSYDTELRLTAVTNPQGLVWRYDYDPAGNLERETDFNGRVLSYVHDAAGQLVERTNGADQSTRFVRDPLGNVIERHATDATATFAYDGAGRIVHSSNADAEIIVERDALGQVVAEKCNGRTVSSTYDTVGRRVRRRTPSGAESVWEYDACGRPTELRTAGRSVRFGYDVAGRETERQLGGGVVLAQSWDTNHRLLSQALSATTLDPARQHTMIQRRDYQYRPDGYLTGITDQISGARTFNLDPAGRITTVQGQGWTERYAYDPAGNITHATWPADNTTDDSLGEREYTGTLIRRAGNTRYRHDAQGRVIMRQRKRLSAKPLTWHYTWDADDRLVAVVTPEQQRWRYRYDPLGRRIAKQRLDSGDTVAEQIDFTWDGTVLAEQTQATGRVTTWDWEPGTFRPVTQTERTSLRDAPQEWVDEQFYNIVTDLIGTPNELVDTNGDIAWHSHTTLWGALLSGPAARKVYTPLRFPGQYHDPETGLNYNYHRYYDPATARYDSNDPLGLAPAPNPQTYVHNPATWFDTFGLAPGCDIVGARFAQKSFSETFSSGGLFSGRTINDVAADLRSGVLSPKDVPINVVVRDGNTLITNTRSAQALTRAEISRELWNVINRTGDPLYESLLSGQLSRNGLTSAGYEFPR